MELTLHLPENVERIVKGQAEKQGVSLETVILDSLEKTAGEPDILPAHPQRVQMLKEVEAYKNIHPMLVKDHLGDYVAIFHGQVVDSDQNSQNLLRRIEEKLPDQVVLLRKVEEAPEKTLYFRSPRITRL